MQSKIKLLPEHVIKTISVLEKRIADRFPESGLRNTCADFLEIAKKSKTNIEWIAKPNVALRLFSYLIILIGLGGIAFGISNVEFKIEDTTITNIVALSEAVFNDIILLGAAIFFLVGMESRQKRKRALEMLNELRVTAHVIDMLQLTKDPSLINSNLRATVNSPKRSLTKFEMERYLDYSSELASLIAKIGALYSQSLPDEVVVRSVNEIEILCTGLSRKIWQKIMILNQIED
tara:strand:- start:109 stop:810 length:702 start_codon:yes stop_codon:yes gene_type:complete